MRNRTIFITGMAALLLTLAYRVYITGEPLDPRPWYQGQDITDWQGPLPFDARQSGSADYPERDDGGDLPSDVYRAYIDAAAAGRFDKGLLTDGSLRLFESREPSAEQLRNSVASYRECRGAEELGTYDRAVLRFAPDLRLCNPVMLQREQGHWRLDFAAMHDAIGHNHRNQWHFLGGQPPAGYAFAFSGWRFDKNGYPLIP